MTRVIVQKYVYHLYSFMYVYTNTYIHTLVMVVYAIIGWISSQKAFKISLFQVQHLKALIDLIRALRPVRGPRTKIVGIFVARFLLVVPSI